MNVAYPAAFSEDYLRPEVRLEIGPLASWDPSDRHVIQPYAADSFPEVFEEPDCPVVAIAVERTFWEKAIILHQEAHREGATPSRYSRHYYDTYKLATSPSGRSRLKTWGCSNKSWSSNSAFIPAAGLATKTPGRERFA